jgi:integrase
MKYFIYSIIVNDLGIKDFSAHSLRHTHASNLLMNNCPVIQVAHRLCHKDASITLKVFSHFVKKLAVDFDEYMPKIHA